MRLEEIKQPIFEKIDFSFESPYSKNHEVNVYKNPSALEYDAVLEKTPYKEIRGLLVADRIVYIWDANLATHQDVVDQLGLESDIKIDKFIISDHDLSSADLIDSSEDILSAALIRRMLGLSKIT